MTSFGNWSFGRVLIICGVWLALNAMYLAWQLLRSIRWAAAALEREGVAAVTVQYGLWALVTFGPILLLLIFWYVVRQTGKAVAQ